MTYKISNECNGCEYKSVKKANTFRHKITLVINEFTEPSTPKPSVATLFRKRKRISDEWMRKIKPM